MVRPVRILFEGAYYHVINRGQDKRQVFTNQKDFKSFVQILKRACQIYQVEIVAYCLMSNHYHLLVHTPYANLPMFMRQLNGSYVQTYNHRYSKDGPLFKGRYLALVVQNGSYLLRVIRYIHKNPHKAHLVKNIDNYKWSSHPSFIKEMETDWLKYKSIFKNQWKKSKTFQKEYLNFISMDDRELDEFYTKKNKKVIESIILGNESYQDKIKTAYLHNRRYYDEVPEAKRAIDRKTVKTIIKKTTEAFKINRETLMQTRRGTRNLPRMLAIGIVRELTGLAYKEIAREFDIKNYMTVKKCYERMKFKLKTDKTMAKYYNIITKGCRHVPT